MVFFFGTKCDIYDYGNYRHLLSICILLGSKSLEQWQIVNTNLSRYRS